MSQKEEREKAIVSSDELLGKGKNSKDKAVEVPEKRRVVLTLNQLYASMNEKPVRVARAQTCGTCSPRIILGDGQRIVMFVNKEDPEDFDKGIVSSQELIKKGVAPMDQTAVSTTDLVELGSNFRIARAF